MYGIKINTVDGKVVERKGYLTYSKMRSSVKKYLSNRKLIVASFYEYKIDRNGFRIVNKWEV